jgi:hypothetical protein
MLQAGSETPASTTAMCIARLSVENGLEIQERAYNAIMEVYDGDVEKALKNSYKEETVEYVVCLYKEAFVSCTAF